jgi:hypothetical protein
MGFLGWEEEPRQQMKNNLSMSHIGGIRGRNGGGLNGFRPPPDGP